MGILMVICLITFGTGFSLSAYTFWSPEESKNLWCPVECDEFTNLERGKCCACKAVPQWLTGDTETETSYQHLSVEMKDTRGVLSKLNNHTSFNVNNTVFSVRHVYGNLKMYPENICDFQIVTIDFTGNKMSTIGNLACLDNLDTLILSRNRITFVSNESFTGMAKLRKVDLSYNEITELDSNAFWNNGLLVLDVDISGNRIRTLDITNIYSFNNTVCGVSYANNQAFIELTNEENVQLGLQPLEPYCANGNFENAVVSQNPVTVMTAHIDIQKLPFYFQCGIWSFTGSAYDCNCEVSELLQLTYHDFARLSYKPEYESYCRSPEEVAGITIVEAMANPLLQDYMTCDVKDFCHSRPHCHCRCTLQPSQHRLIVNCSDQSCTDLPDVVPNSKYDVTLIMHNNSISRLNGKDYFNRVEVLDLSENPVRTLDNNVDQLTTAKELLLYGHQLETLPKTVKKLNPKLFLFGTNGINCNCENAWIGEWRKLRNISSTHPLFCSNYPSVLIEYYVDHIAICESDPLRSEILILVFLSAVTFLFSLFSLSYYFRYECLVLKRRSQGSKLLKGKQKDIYISFDVENDDVREFIIELDKVFLTRRLTTFIPFRDSTEGTIEDDVIVNLRKCKYVLVVQSKDIYTRDDRSLFRRRLEYNLAWNDFVNRSISNILVLNFDSQRPEKYMYRQTRALYRFGLGFVIPDRKQSLYSKMFDIFDKPLVPGWC